MLQKNHRDPVGAFRASWRSGGPRRNRPAPSERRSRKPDAESSSHNARRAEVVAVSGRASH